MLLLLCTYMGLPGHLATVTSADEQAFLSENLSSGTYFFIGGLQVPGGDEPDQGWMWVTGETWDYTAWETGEPNNSGGAEDKLQWTPSPKGWNDITGNSSIEIGYIVEYESVPEPSSLALFAIAGLLSVAYARVRCQR